MPPTLTFIIPVRHKANAPDWTMLKANLAATIASIAAQTNADWRAVIVANTGDDLPRTPAGFDVARVDFPPNAAYDIRAGREAALSAFRLDKGRRVLHGMSQAVEPRFFMIVDDDDLVSNRIVEFASGRPTSDGWRIDRGYVWTHNGRMLLAANNFSSICGTSLIVRASAYRLPKTASAASDQYIGDWLGSHVAVQRRLESDGIRLAPLPFRGAIYRVGHDGAHSRSGSMARAFFLNRKSLSNPVALGGNLLALRRLTPALEAEFFGRRGAPP